MKIPQVDASQRTLVGKTFLVHGVIEHSNHYDGGYAKAQDTHAAFEISAGGRSLNVYMANPGGKELAASMTNFPKQLGTFTLRIDPARFSMRTPPRCELLVADPPQPEAKKIDWPKASAWIDDHWTPTDFPKTELVTIQEVISDQVAFSGARFAVRGVIGLTASVYLHGYEDAAATHKVFLVRDHTDRITVYMENEKAELLREAILRYGPDLQGDFVLELRPERMKPGQFFPVAELVDVKKSGRIWRLRNR